MQEKVPVTVHTRPLLVTLYCWHQDDYEELLREFVSGIFTDPEIADRVHLRFGVYIDARQEPDVEERFVRAEIAAQRTKDDPRSLCGFYELD